MFVAYELLIARPAGDVGRELIARSAEVADLGTAAYRNGEELRSRVGPFGGLAKEVVVAMGRPRLVRNGLILPVTWRATGAVALFPRLHGELEITAVDHGEASLRLRASYRPPFGWIGDVVDRLVLARFARLTVADWLQRVAETIADGAPVRGVPSESDIMREDARSGVGKHYLHGGADPDHRAK